MSNETKDVKRYNLVLPEELFDEVQRVAQARQTSVVELIRKFIKIGLLAIQIEETPGASLLIREGDSEQRLILL